jgi:cytochrome c biogenesis protein CcmG, thiol:disulfide interchange protein DsbE
MFKSKILLPLAAVALGLLGAALLTSSPTVPQAVAAEAPSRAKAPEIALETLDGKKYKLSQDPNKVVVIDFWATWCGPCVKSLPKLQETADWVKKENLKVSIYPANLQETPSEVLEFWMSKGFTMPVLMDVKGEVAKAYNVNVIPTTVLIIDGKIAKTYTGMMSPKVEAEFRAAIQEGLKATSAAPAAEKPKDAPKA